MPVWPGLQDPRTPLPIHTIPKPPSREVFTVPSPLLWNSVKQLSVQWSMQGSKGGHMNWPKIESEAINYDGSGSKYRVGLDGVRFHIFVTDRGKTLAQVLLESRWWIVNVFIAGVPATRNEVIYDCCPEPYLDITFVVRIRRRTLYYFFNLIVPCLLIASMAVLGFTLPPDSGEKLSLGESHTSPTHESFSFFKKTLLLLPLESLWKEQT